MYHFKTDVKNIGRVLYSDSDIKNEPMLFSCEIEKAYDMGGRLTRRVLDNILSTQTFFVPKGYTAVVDTKVAMLMPGFYPCIGGWHVDAIERCEGGQPDLSTLDSNQGTHYLYQASTGEQGTGSQTEFLTKDLEMSPMFFDDKDENVWATVNGYLGEIDPPVQVAKDGVIYKMGGTTLHRGTQAKRRGWRFFFRLSVMKTTPRNQIRKQVQIYKDISQGY